MKKIAYLGFSYVSGTMKRASAYAKANPEFSHTFLAIDDYIKQPIFDFGCDVTVARLSQTTNDFDLVLPMSDKSFDAYLKYRGIRNVMNVCNKLILNDACKRLGIVTPKTEGFLPDDDVIAKPLLSSGGYSEDPFCYKRVKYKEIFELLPFSKERLLVQEFIDSDQVIQFNLLCDGKKIIPAGVTDFQFDTGYGVTANPLYNFSYPNIEKFAEHVNDFSDKVSVLQGLLDDAIRLFTEQKYATLPGFYQFQYIHKDGKFYANDANLRLGPGNVEASLANLFPTNPCEHLKFMLGMISAEETQRDENLAYTFYTESNGVRLTKPEKLLVEDRENRIRCIEKKSSGFLRDDCETYIQLMRI